MKPISPEKRARRQASRAMAKCERCGNILSLHDQGAGRTKHEHCEKPATSETHDDFYRGVIAALGVLRNHGHAHGSTMHDEIVRSVGEVDLYRVAEDDDYEWAGLNPEKKP